MRALLISGIICLVLSFAAIVTFIWLKVGTGGHIPFDFGIVMDAGSSHTEVLLYKWSADQLNGTGMVEQASDCATHIGIDDNESKTNITIKDLMPCVRQVTASVPEDDMPRSVPVYLGATAGMRILNATNPDVSQLIFVSLENAILRFKNNASELDVKTFRIIDGREEALYAWISANYLSGLIPNLGKKQADVENIDSVGILDMGGASAQIAYEVKKEHLTHFEPSELQKVKLYGHEFYVRGESNLCLGSDEMLKRHRVLQIIANTGARTNEDPCYNDGITIEVKGEYLQTVCTEAVTSELDSFIKPDEMYIFKGKYDKEKCQEINNKNIDSQICKSTFKRCLVAEKHAPPPDVVLFAVSNYFYATVPFQMKETTVDDFMNKTDQLCKKSMDEVKSMPKVNPKFADDFCFKLNVIYSILTKLYRFESKQWANLRIRSKVNGQSLGWALGFMIHETSLIPAESPSDSLLSTTAFVILLICALVLFALAIFLLVKWKNRGGERNVAVTAKEQHALKDYNGNR